MKILITGASGFIGSPLAHVALERGHEVVGLDIVPPRISGYRHEDVDIRDRDAVHDVMDHFAPDAVVHLAALHYIPSCNEHPDETMATNVTGTRFVLEACEAARVSRLFLASTAAVYRPSPRAHTENDEVCPIDIYGLTKAFDEQLVEGFARRTGTAVVVGRIFNVYGPGDPNPHVIPEMVGQLKPQLEAADGELVLRLGNLTPARDYIHVSDAAAAICRLVVSEDGSGGTYNIGSGVATSVADLVSIAEGLVGTHITIEQSEERKRAVDRPMLLSDASRLSELGWVSETRLDRGLGSLLATR